MDIRKKAIRQVSTDFASQPFQWGILDCCQFVAKVATIIEGVDYSRGFDYQTESEAELHIESAGGLSRLVTQLLSRDPVDIDQLKIGDPVLVDLPVFGHTLGIYIADRQAALIKTVHRVVHIPSERIIEGWPLNARCC